MTTEQKQLVASEMRSLGFDSVAKDDCVIVALRRWLGFDEVRIALEQVFGDIEFQLKRYDSYKVKVM